MHDIDTSDQLWDPFRLAFVCSLQKSSLFVCFLESYVAGRAMEVLDPGRILYVLEIVYTVIRDTQAC